MVPKPIRTTVTKLFITTLFLVSSILSTTAQSDEVTEFKNFFASYVKAYESNPAKALREGAAPDYQIVAGDGIVRSLEETTKIHDSAKSLKLTLENEKYRVYGNTGIVTGKANYAVEFGDGKGYQRSHLFTYVFAKGKDGWKQVSAQHLDLK